MGYSRFIIVFSGLLALTAASVPGLAYDEPDRTANRSLMIPVTPDWVFAKPEHYEFTPLASNQDPQNGHPAAWQGQDWDTRKWGPDWTPDTAIQKFFRARIFDGQYMKDNVPIVELGPTFYKLSDLDQRRTLKLLTDAAAIFKKYPVVELIDWSSRDIIGTYTPQGMFLN